MIRLITTLAVIMLATASTAQELDKTGQPVVSQSISVADAVNIAIKNSPMLDAKKAEVAAAAARVGMARAMSRPQVSTSTFATTGSMEMIVPGSPNVEPQNFSIAPNKTRLDQNLMGMYPLYTGGRIRNQVGGATAQQEASSHDATATELDVALGVKNTYYQALLNRKSVEAYQQRVNEAKERVRIAEAAFREGRIAKYDLLRNQTELADAEQQLNNGQRDLDMAVIDLKNMMGISQTSQLTMTDELTCKTVDESLEDLQAKAVSNRPEVAAARAKVRSAEAALGVSKSSYKPQVYATAMVDAGVMKDDGFDNGYLVGVTAALPLLDGGSRKSAVSEAQAMIRQMKADERVAILNVSRDVASAYAQLDAATRNVSLAQASVTQAEEDYRVIRMRYEAGKATNVEVLDALASLTRARTNYAEALYSQSTARETLLRATGQR